MQASPSRPPAYPNFSRDYSQFHPVSYTTGATPVPGATLRDFFAANANEDDIARHLKEGMTIEQAKYRYADAMCYYRNLG